MVRKEGRANDLEGDRECFSQQEEVESFLTRLLKRGLSPFPFAPDSLLIDEDPRSFRHIYCRGLIYNSRGARTLATYKS